MATADRPASDPLDEPLLKGAKRFSFFQVVRLLERYYRPEARIGRQGPAAGEILRFRPESSLGFPASDVVDVEAMAPSEEAPARFRVTTSFLGLYGTTSPLPLFYTEDILRRDPEEDAARAFIDLFQHRLLSLFYRTWLKYRYHVQFEEEGKDDFSQRMLALVGLGTSGLAGRIGPPAVRLIRYAGLLTLRSHSASALEGFLSDFFDDLPTQVVQCAERWVTIRPEQRIRLGGANCRLAVDASLGEQVLSRGGKFRIILGPMGYLLFLTFLPDGESFRRVHALVALFVPDRLLFDIELQVRAAEIPPLRLTSTDPARLGWTTWLPGRVGDARERSVVLN